MDEFERKIIDNVIYTPDFDCTPDPKGFGHYCYTQMLNKKDKIAQIDGYTKEEDTYGAFLKRSVRTALTMIDEDVKPGDHISLCAYIHFDASVPIIASYFTGSIMGAIDPSMSVEEASHLLEQTLPKMIFVDPSAVPLVEIVIKRIGTKSKIVVFGETDKHTPFSKFIRPHKDEHEFKPREVESLDEIAAIVFSSGSTGRPKGVCYNNFSLMCYNPVPTPFDRSITLCTVSNPYWIVFLSYLHLSIVYDFTRILFPTFNTKDPWEMFYQPVDMAFLNPYQVLHLVRSEMPQKADLKNVGVLRVGGLPVSPKELVEIRSALPHTIVSLAYSQTEVIAGMLHFHITPTSLKLMERNLNSSGTVTRGLAYKIVDIETGKTLGPNQVGELRIKSKSHFSGYFNLDSSDCFDSEGFMKTGDLLYYNEDLCFYYVDRIRESFKYFGYHICPIELETVILNLEPIEKVVVIGIPHETDYHHPTAIVKLKPNAREISAEEIVKLVEETLEDHKRLRGGVKFVNDFPMTVTDKISRYRLKKMVLNNEI